MCSELPMWRMGARGVHHLLPSTEDSPVGSPALHVPVPTAELGRTNNKHMGATPHGNNGHSRRFPEFLNTEAYSLGRVPFNNSALQGGGGPTPPPPPPLDPPPLTTLGQFFASAPSAQLIHVVARFFLPRQTAPVPRRLVSQLPSPTH